MKYGSVTGLDEPISRLGLGSVPFLQGSYENSCELLDTFIAAGGTLIDCACNYGDGEAHRVFGRYLKERGNRDKLVIFNKGCHHTRVRRLTRDALTTDLYFSRHNLGIEASDFFVLHRDDQLVPIGDVVEWANEHIQSGAIRLLGASNFHHSRIVAANKYAEAHGLQGFCCSSPNFSLASPSAMMWEDAIFMDPITRLWHEETQFPLFSWSSAGGGFFAGIVTPDIERVYFNKVNLPRLERAKEFAAKRGCSSNSIALAWLLAQPMNLYALIGPTNISQLKDNLEALEVSLDPDEVRYLEHGH